MSNSPKKLFNAGDNLKNFAIGGFLGRLGQIEFYRSTDSSKKEPVIISALPKGNDPQSELAQRFQYEAEALHRMNNSFIVKVVEKGDTDKFFYMVYENYSTSTLADYLVNASFSIVMLKKVLLNIVESVYYLHEFGLVHGSLSADRYHLSPSGEFKLTDLGVTSGEENNLSLQADSLAAHIRESTTTVSANIVEKSAPSFRNDIKSLGFLLVDVITAGTSPVLMQSSKEMRVEGSTVFPKWAQICLPKLVLGEIVQMIENESINSAEHLRKFLDVLNESDFESYSKRIYGKLGSKYPFSHLIITSKVISNLPHCLKRLRANNLDPASINFILHIAIALRKSKNGGFFKKSQSQQSVEVSDPTLDQACEIFRMPSTVPNVNNNKKSSKKKLKRKNKNHNPTPSRGILWFFKYLLFVTIAVISPFIIAPFLPNQPFNQFQFSGFSRLMNLPKFSSEEDSTYTFNALPVQTPLLGAEYTYRNMAFDNHLVRTSSEKKILSVVKVEPTGAFYLRDSLGFVSKHNLIPSLPPTVTYDSQRNVVYQSKINGNTKSFLPLKKGSSFDVQIFEVDNGARSFFSYKCTTLNKVQVMVPAGSYKTVLVECKKEGDSNIRQFYYSPRVRAIVLEQYVKSHSKDQIIRRKELVTYRIHKK